MIRPRALHVIGVLAITACADIPVHPSAPEGLRRHDASLLAAQADGPGTYILSFKNERIPKDLDAKVAKLGGKIAHRHAQSGIAVVSGLDAAGATLLGSDKELDAIDANAYIKLERRTGTFGGRRGTKDPSQALLFPLQWHLSAVGAPVAWDHEQLGSRKVDVGILDTGIDYLNPEFEGLLDIERSQLFSDCGGVSDEFCQPIILDQVPDGVRTFADFSGHGTGVAGVAVSKAQLTAGILSKAELVAIKVCNLRGECDLIASLLGVLYAADLGLDVINISSGGLLERKGRKFQAGPSLIRTVEKIFRYAHRRGVTVVVSAGNEARDLDARVNLDDDPELEKVYNLYCDVPNVICVSATGPNDATIDPITGAIEYKNIDTPATYSNFGRRVDVAAPGGTAFIIDNGDIVFAPIFTACSRYDVFVPCDPDLPLEQRSPAVWFGTSFAAPHVAGLAALLADKESFRRNPSRIARRIFRSATDCGASGKDVLCGHGQINIAKALRLEDNDD